jgi:hypothetical protein
MLENEHEWIEARLQQLVISHEAAERFNHERYESLKVSVAQRLEEAKHDRERMMLQLRENIELAMTAQRVAVDKAEVSIEKRFDAVNEFRAQLGDQARTLMPRAEAEVLFKGIATRFEAENKVVGDLDARVIAMRSEQNGSGQGFKSGWALALGVGTLITLIIGIAAFFISILKH